MRKRPFQKVPAFRCSLPILSSIVFELGAHILSRFGSALSCRGRIHCHKALSWTWLLSSSQNLASQELLFPWISTSGGGTGCARSFVCVCLCLLGPSFFLIVDEGVMQLTGARVHAPLSRDQSTFFLVFVVECGERKANTPIIANVFVRQFFCVDSRCMHSAMSAYSETDEEFFLVRTGHQCGRHTVTAPLPLMTVTTQFVTACVAGSRLGEVIKIIPKISKTR